MLLLSRKRMVVLKVEVAPPLVWWWHLKMQWGPEAALYIRLVQPRAAAPLGREKILKNGRSGEGSWGPGLGERSWKGQRHTDEQNRQYTEKIRKLGLSSTQEFIQLCQLQNSYLWYLLFFLACLFVCLLVCISRLVLKFWRVRSYGHVGILFHS